RVPPQRSQYRGYIPRGGREPVQRLSVPPWFQGHIRSHAGPPHADPQPGGAARNPPPGADAGATLPEAWPMTTRLPTLTGEDARAFAHLMDLLNHPEYASVGHGGRGLEIYTASGVSLGYIPSRSVDRLRPALLAALDATEPPAGDSLPA